MMSEEFAFNARQYFDFGQTQEDSEGDSFFEIVHDNDPFEVTRKDHQVIHDLSDTEAETLFVTPWPITSNTGISTSTKLKMRRSSSTTKLQSNTTSELQQAMSDIDLNSDNYERSSSSCSHAKRAPATKRINKLAQPKRTNSRDNLKIESMTLAEAVSKFQTGTPQRFRMRPLPTINKYRPNSGGVTKIQSPKLRTTQRARPTTVLSFEEREKLEMEDAKKFRANPINMKVFRGPMKCQIEKNPPTIFEPFNLTEVKKKKPFEQPKVPPFKAQPLPKSIYDPLKLAESSFKPRVSSAGKMNRSLPKTDTSDAATKPSRPTNTQLEPFSFEKRDQHLLKRKEELMNRILEEEKKAREFHARPPPKQILRNRNHNSDHQTEDSVRSYKRSIEDVETTTFKARPATVLTIKPFEPKREEYHDLKVQPFQLTTNQRAQARGKFDEQLREKEMMKEAAKREIEELMKRKEEEEVAYFRRQTEYKAQPIKKYKEIKIQPSNKVTQPISPVFHTIRARNKENVQ